MKPRLPIFDAVGQGFYFGLTRYLAILKITWLPALLAGAIVAAQVWTRLLARSGHAEDLGNLPDYLSLVGWMPFYVLLSIPAVAAYRMAVFGRGAPRGIAYFKLGGTELQFLAAQLVTTVYMIVYVLVALLVVVPIALFAYHLLAPSAAAAATFVKPTVDELSLRLRIGSGATAGFLLMVFFGWVLFQLVQPIVVVEHRIGVWKSLRTLWFGNALRLTIVWAIVGLTFIFFSTLIIGGLDAFGPRILYLLMPDFDRHNLTHLIVAWSILILVPAILLGALALGVTAGVNGYAYRKLALEPMRERSP